MPRSSFCFLLLWAYISVRHTVGIFALLMPPVFVNPARFSSTTSFFPFPPSFSLNTTYLKIEIAFHTW